MATTDAKPGFRLPWSADRSQADQNDAPAADAAAAATADVPTTPDVATPDEETESPAMIDAAPAATTSEAAVDSDGSTAAPTTMTDSAPIAPAATAARKPNKFMADLTKAMQSAAESARSDSMERLSVDAKAHIEAIHADAASEATDLRKRCDDDVAAVREWSKTEIARIREETDERISHRKNKLEREIEDHAAEIESRIERVQARITAFETQMTEFFEKLLAEDDPTRFAAMAESLPEPPSFDGDAPAASLAAEAVAVAEPVVEATIEAVETEAPVDESTAAVAAEPTGWETTPEAVSDAAAETETPVTEEPAWPANEPGLAQPAAAADGEDLFSIGADAPAAEDPRIDALGLTPDFAAAEAEAATFSTDEDGSNDESVPEIADDTIAARLAGLVPDAGATDESATTSTRLTVVGLVSVASIAGFKRHLSRANGVQHVGVSSGPEGEFVYQVTHDANVSLRDIVPALPGFAARVTDESAEGLSVTAQDPEAAN